MPIYEYQCEQCGRKVSIWWRSLAQMERSQLHCSRCGSQQLRRLISRPAVLRSEESMLESLADDSLAGLDENDPRSLGRWMRRMSDEVGEDLGDEFEEIVGRLEAGESPEEIERSLPELGSEGSSFESGDAYDTI